MSTDAVAPHAMIRVDLDKRQPLRRIWRFIGYDEPNYTYTAAGRGLLAKLGGMSDAPYYVRCHFMLCSGDGTGRPKWGSTNVYTEDVQGDPVYNWSLIDRILDAQIEAGCIPFVELGFTPQALTTAPADLPYDDPRHGGWRYPPRDYGRWLELIRNLASHCLTRYGLAEVSKWYWELWNEPDIFYWQGSVGAYCRLYDYTVAGLHAVLPQARVGGPSTTSSMDRTESSQFLRAFLEHCTHGVNALTGQRGTRLDFVSFHAKGGGYGVEPQAAKKTPAIYTVTGNVAAGLAVVNEFPELAGREVILSECDPDGWAAGSIRDNPNLFYRNTEYYASYVACTACKLMDLGRDHGAQVDGMLTWAFQFENRETFAGLRTLSTNGIDKAVLNVFRLLAKLGTTRLQLTSDRARDPLVQLGGDSPDAPPDISGIATVDEAGALHVLLVSHHDDWDVGATTMVTVRVARIVEGTAYTATQSRVTRDEGNAYAAWVDMGRPQPPDVAQMAQLRTAARMKSVDAGQVTAGADGLDVTLTLPAHAVCLLQLTPRA